ncbi:flagellar basal body rod protein FlgC [Natroniella acetigena]|uniref:flagellar basal body rod protein FlgC n=1 Tax=Natroniella acetigena TaxID=52004 RepID=UPI00200B7DF4|nr:flagellar basal body rod protein FlgC [Natroniella acetigena]MCK8826320.1 flagellar basal body rod protein FlgC [Natroniella acetigena]
MGVFNGMNVSSSGLTAQRVRMDLISNNIANVNTTRTEDGGPYRRQVPVFATRLQDELDKFNNNSQTGEGVKITKIAESDEPARLEYRPEHPDANQDGYVEKPNVNIVSEMTDMISATRAYEANVTALDSAKSMFESALRIG